MKCLPAASLLAATLPAVAAESFGAAGIGAAGLQAILGFGAVLAVMALAAWALKRFGIARTVSGSPVKIVGGVSVGGRERVMVIEAGDQWIVVGVAPGRVNALTTMPRQETSASSSAAPEVRSFSARLKQSVESRNGS
jgi:flagellar protein FliO/FliZ